MNQQPPYHSEQPIAPPPTSTPQPPVVPPPALEAAQGSRFTRSWQLLKASLNALKKDKSLIGVQLAGSLISIVVMMLIGAILATVAIGSGIFAAESQAADGRTWDLYMIPMIFIVTIIMATVATYVAVAASYGALRVFSGNNVTVGECLSAANKRLRSIVSFGLLSGTIGFILRALEDRLGSLAATIATRLVGAVWSIATMFVPAVIAASSEYQSAPQAAKKSALIIKQTWGESLILSVGIGLAGGLVSFIYILLASLVGFSLWILSAPATVTIALLVVAVIGLLLLTMILSTLSAIVNTAIYFYAVHGQAPAGFNPALLQSVFATRHKKKSRFAR